MNIQDNIHDESFSLPSFGLGTWQLRDDQLETAMDTALACGYRYFDTSYMYQNEAKMGSILQRWFSEGRVKRDEICISSKMPNFIRKPEQIDAIFRKQLSNLKLDCIDLYFLHYPIGVKYAHYLKTKEVIIDNASMVESWKVLENFVYEGKIKYLGLSNVDQEIIERILDKSTIAPVNIQIETHPFNPQTDLIDYCKKNNLTVTAICPLGSPGFNRFLIENGIMPELLPPVMYDWFIRDMAKRYGKTAAQLILRFSLERGLTVIAKSCNPLRIKENIESLNFKLRPEDMSELFNMYKPQITCVLKCREMIPLPMTPIFSDTLVQLEHTIELSPITPPSSSSSSSTEESIPQEKPWPVYEPEYFIKCYQFNKDVQNLSVEVASPNIVVVRGVQSYNEGGPLRPFLRTFLLPSRFSIHDIVANLSPYFILSVTTDPYPKKGCLEIPIYCNEDP